MNGKYKSRTLRFKWRHSGEFAWKWWPQFGLRERILRRMHCEMRSGGRSLACASQ